jgi:hypothetical protein
MASRRWVGRGVVRRSTPLRSGHNANSCSHQGCSTSSRSTATDTRDREMDVRPVRSKWADWDFGQNHRIA